MKVIKFILLSSFVANVALAVVYFSADTRRTAQQAAPLLQAKAQLPTTAERWESILKTSTADDAAFVARLRAEGFPPSIVSTIVRGMISERFSAQRRALQANSDEYAYWKSWSSIRSSNPEARAALRKLDREQFEMVRQLLGEDALRPYEKARQETKYGNLPADKIKQLELISRDYQELMQQVQAEARGLLLSEDKEKLAFLRKEQKADIASLLTPEEQKAYEVRSSSTAEQLKGRLQLFAPTEQEYLALYALQKDFDDRFAQGGYYGESVPNRDEAKARGEALAQLNKNIEAALGPARYKDYKITTDYEYRRVSQLAERLSLPDTTAKAVVSLKIDTEEQLKSIRSNQSLDRQQREAQLSALAQDVTTKLTQQLGTEGFNAYRDSGGYWFKNLSPANRTSVIPAR
ncbi:MAG: hypothetical protein QM790_01075 [Nibricoccus sp.]